MVHPTSIAARAPVAALEAAGRAEGAGWAAWFPTVAAVSREFGRAFFDPYRPERHYMRGPGPRWRGRHGARQANGRSHALKGAGS